MALQQSVVLFGDFSEERIPIGLIAEEFGFTTHSVADLGALYKLQKQKKIAAVLVRLESANTPWPELLPRVQSVLRGSPKVIACHRPELADFRAQLVAAGAFYTLLLPLVATELRQAIGFVWAARRARVHEMPAKAVRHISRSAGAA